MSTLGCPELTLAEAATLATRHGYRGLELRSGPGGTVHTSADSDDRRRWRRELDVRGIHALAVASYIRLCDTRVDDADVVNSGIQQLQLAHDLGATWLRVFPGGVRSALRPSEVERRGADRLAKLAAASSGLGVDLAVETHDSHPSASDVVRLLDAAETPDVAVIWDVLHTWLAREEPEDTVRLLGNRVAYVQVKDVPTRHDLTPLPLGEGVLPLRACLDLVRTRNLTSWVSWEYERLWHPQAARLDQVAGPGQQWLTKALSEHD